ncbi:MAG: hypothetical protein WCT10_00300 [Patescibacteria group bacterium]|jgi:hypothetical protein
MAAKKLKIVDGFKIRNTQDIEFCALGDQDIYPYVKPGQLWLERYFLPEKDFLLHVYRIKKRLVKKFGWEKAKALLRPDKFNRDLPQRCRLELLARHGQLKIYLADGPAVRRHLDPDFFFGGHNLVYKYVPKNEIWLDSAAAGPELKYIAVHELFEYALMKRGKCYNDAHEYANAAEKEARRKDGLTAYPKD